ncbi:unnamed protein product [Cyclocybe aegerita]|uniref:DUF6534 domain-containing protein n=1 Tax=Cyclocybe aegerita TaxID=1973307 RepID=A0A8S0X3J2_CYCAE|nr:unnamed protein product [Cyclocybe aegerita]
MAWVNPVSLKGPAEIAHGWMLIGCAINILLLGVTFAQVYMYYTEYRGDRPWLKILVACVLIFDILNSVALFSFLYRSLITFFGDNEALATGSWILATGAWTTGVIACAVQSFFAWRIYMLTKKWIYVVVIGSLAITGAAAAIITTIQTGISRPFVEFLNFKATVTVWLVSEVAADIIITSALVWYLVSRLPISSANPKADFASALAQAQDRFRAVGHVTLQTGLLTMIIASVDLFFFLFDPSGTHFLFNFPLSKLYANSLMSSLNSRRGWKFSGISHVGTGTGSESQGITTSWVQRHLRISTVPRPLDEISQVESQEMRDIQAIEKAHSRPRETVHIHSGSVDMEKWATGRSQWIG